MLTSTADRVRKNTPERINASIDRQIDQSFERYRGRAPSEIDQRLRELDREWDIERAVELEAPLTIAAGLTLGAVVDRKWSLLSIFAGCALLLHGLQGWHPLLPLLRRMGFRTHAEIHRERAALAATRSRPLEERVVPPTETRVTRHTSSAVNEEIRAATDQNVDRYRQADVSAINRRLAELDREWDVERWLQTNFAAVCLAGLGLGAFVNGRWNWLPAVASAFMVQHSIQGWCPPLPIFRRLGVRTASEIDRERQQLLRLREATQRGEQAAGCAAGPAEHI